VGRRAPDKLQLGIACSIPTAFASAPSNRREGADSKADAEGKGDTSTGKADYGSNKASGGKDSSGATSGHKAAHKNNK